MHSVPPPPPSLAGRRRHDDELAASVDGGCPRSAECAEEGPGAWRGRCRELLLTPHFGPATEMCPVRVRNGWACKAGCASCDAEPKPLKLLMIGDSGASKSSFVLRCACVIITDPQLLPLPPCLIPAAY